MRFFSFLSSLTGILEVGHAVEWGRGGLSLL